MCIYIDIDISIYIHSQKQTLRSETYLLYKDVSACQQPPPRNNAPVLCVQFQLWALRGVGDGRGRGGRDRERFEPSMMS